MAVDVDMVTWSDAGRVAWEFTKSCPEAKGCKRKLSCSVDARPAVEESNVHFVVTSAIGKIPK